MTNDYKEELLKYLTGNIHKGVDYINPYYIEEDNFDNTEAMSTGFNVTQIIDILYCKNANGQNNGKVLVYGNGYTNGSWQGFLQIFDEGYHLINTFKEYSSGTPLSPFEKLNIDEQGQVFGIDYSSSQHRFIMLNNVSEKGNLPDYQCILRQSYFLQGDITNAYYDSDTNSTYSGILSVDKSKQSAYYFMSGVNLSKDTLYGTSFRINVGVPNEWVNYTSGALYGGIFLDTYVYFDIQDNISANIYFEEDTNNGSITRVSNNGTSLNQYDVLLTNINQFVTNTYDITAKVINRDKLYFSVSGMSSTNSIVEIVLFDKGKTNVAYEKQGTGAYTGATTKFRLIDNKLFVSVFIPTGIVNGEIKGEVYVNLISDIDTNYETKLDEEFYKDNNTSFIVSNAFNIYNILYSDYTATSEPIYMTYSTKIIYRNGYNGEAKEDTNDILPKQGILFDNENNLIFARDLYNNKTYNNRSISVLNVPNTFLNDVQIGNEKLLSDTNIELVDNNEAIEKNVYEDLYINFNNQITMQNQNDPNYVDNLPGAIRLNQSSGKTLDYDNAKANKIRVTYDDNTSYITMASNSIANNKCTYSIVVHVPNDKNIQSIDIISNDENTIYQTINNLSLTKNKYYIITQDVYVV